MGDQIEDFINRNRSEFEEKVDDLGIWEQIESELTPTPGFNWSNVWKAAAVLFLISTVILAFERSSEGEQLASSPLYEEFSQAEGFYVKLISQKQQELLSYDTELTQGFIKDLTELDSMYDNLKTIFKEQGTDEKLIGAMISNLQLQIEILNKQLKILENIKATENEQSINI